MSGISGIEALHLLYVEVPESMQTAEKDTQLVNGLGWTDTVESAIASEGPYIKNIEGTAKTPYSNPI